MSYNVQNFDSGVSDWVVRKLHVAKVILEHAPDVIGVQELRTRGTRCQAKELAALLPAYTYVRDTASTYEEGHTEGLAVYYNTQRLTLNNHSVTALGASAQDLNARICQRVTLALTAHPACRFELFHTHLSYQPTVQVENVKKVIRRLLVGKPSDDHIMQLLVGDLNTHRDSLRVRDILTGKIKLTVSERRRKKFIPFVDVWAALHPDDDQGLTYSTVDPMTRCDYVMARGGFTPVNASTAGARLGGNALPTVAPSDHFAVLATLRFDETPHAEPQGWTQQRTEL